MAGGTINFLFRVSKQDDALGKLNKGFELSREKCVDLSKAATGLGRTLGGVGGVIGNLSKTLLTGGIWELAAQGVMLLIDKFKELKEKASEATKEAARNMTERLGAAADSIQRKFDKLYDSIARIGEKSKDAGRGFGAVADTITAGNIGQINDNARARLADARDDAERAVIKADAALQIAKEKYAQAERHAAESVEDAQREQGILDKKISAAKEKQRALYAVWARAQNRYNEAVTEQKDDMTEYKEAKKALDKAMDDLAAAEEDVAKLQRERATKETDALVARQKSSQAAIEATNAVKEAEFNLAEAMRKQKEAADARAKAEAADTARRKLEADMVRREQAQEDAEFEARQNMIEYYDLQAEQGKKHLRELAPRVKKLDAQIDALTLRLKNAKDGIARTGRGQAADAAHTNGLFGPYQYGGRANGGENFTDWQRAQRFAEHGDRDAKKAARRDAAAQKRYDRLADEQRRGRRLSDRDKGFMRDWENFQDQKGGAAALQQKLEAAQKARDQLQKEIDKTLKSIDQNIKDALAIA